MKSCLGIYLGDKIIKYAKLIQEDKSKRISLDVCGTKYVVGNKGTAVAEIINQTGSLDALLTLNTTDYFRIQTEVLKQLGKSDVQSVINLEVADYANGRGINEKTLEYRYIFTDSSVSNDNYTADIAAVEKTNIAKYGEDAKYNKLVGIYPQEYIMTNLVQNNANYLLVNVDEKTQIISVVNGRIKKIYDLDVSMKNILDTIAEHEGSYSKACELCKSINVLSDESLSPELERVIEPAIQDLLNRIKSKIDDAKISYEKIYISGLINLFINIEVLFEEFLGITSEKLKPYFLKSAEDLGNINEIIEANDAIALAYEGILDINPEVNFYGNVSKGSLFGKDKGVKFGYTKGSGKKVVVMPNINMEKVESGLLLANLTAATVFAGYVGFSAIYDKELTDISNKLTAKIDALQDQTVDITADTAYINQNTDKYTTFNNYITDTVAKIREGKIGKYTTYNVANFMQKVAKYIPTNVTIETISSNDNKNVTIVAKSTSYSELGYFISQLKLKGILNNISTGKVQTGSVIVVTIGGELP